MPQQFPSQALKEQADERFARTIALVSRLTAVTVGDTTPPGSPSTGDVYIPGSVPAEKISGVRVDANDENLHIASATPWSGWTGSSNFAIELYFDSDQNDQVLLHNQGSTSGSKKIEISVNSEGHAVFEIVDGSGNNHKVEGSTPVDDGEMHLISVVRDGSQDGNSAASEIYVDGGLEVHDSETVNSVGDIFRGEGIYIGLPSALSQTRQPNAVFRELRIWGFDQSEVNIAHKASEELAGTETNIEAHIPMDEGSGSTAADSVASHDGTLQGGADWGEVDNVFRNVQPSNAWAGLQDHIVIWEGDEWNFIPPSKGMKVLDEQGSRVLVYDGTQWTADPYQPVGAGSGGDSILTDRNNPGDVLQRRGDGVVLVERV